MMRGASQQSVATSVVPFSNFTFLQRRERSLQQAGGPRSQDAQLFVSRQVHIQREHSLKAISASSIETQLSYAHQESTVNLIQLLQTGNADGTWRRRNRTSE